MIRKEAWPFYRTSSGVRLCWELEEPKGPKKEGAEAGDLPRNRLTCTGPLSGSRSKVVALENPRNSSQNIKKWTRAEHRSNRLPAMFLVPRWDRPEGSKPFISQKSILFTENTDFWFAPITSRKVQKEMCRSQGSLRTACEDISATARFSCAGIPLIASSLSKSQEKDLISQNVHIIFF